jgi:NAD(P)-dependent dehydrogenase (short-subunit alcohol dehydrogenase family)
MPVTWTFDDIPDQTGRTAVVTGATSGLGLVAARELAARGADVVVAARNVAKAERLFPGGVHIRALDTENLDSVRAFAADWGDRPLDLLINNAGISAVPWRLSPQGVESQFATNFLGHFALTGLLLPHMRGGARVVTVSSSLYRRAKALPLDDMSGRAGYTPMGAYAASKLADLLFGLELERRLRRAGRPVRSLVVHPGVAGTPMMTHTVGSFARALVPIVRTLVARSAASGSLPILYAATSPDAPTGVLLGPPLPKWDHRVRFDEVARPADEPALAARLWRAAQERSAVAYLDGVPV